MLAFVLQRCLFVIAIAALGACAGEPDAERARSPDPARETSSSSVCQAIANQFVALPEGLDREPAGGAPSLGRWWVRGCTTEAAGAQLRVRLEGPAWYWVDRKEGSFRVRQHVHFRVRAELVGSFQPGVAWRDGVVSLWFHPRGANVDVQPLGEITPSSDNFVMTVLQELAMPLPRYNVEAQAKRQFEDEATSRFRKALERGYTVVYDVERGQPDFALSVLQPGTLPLRPFDDGRSWLANERLMLAPGAPHVLGPFEAAEELALDVRIRKGSGIAYRAVCAPDLRRAFDVAEDGKAGRVPMTEIVDTGQVRQRDSARRSLRVPDCAFYLVVSALGDDLTESDIRVR